MAHGAHSDGYKLLTPEVRLNITYAQFVESQEMQKRMLGVMESIFYDAYFPQPEPQLMGLHYVVHYSRAGDADYYLLMRLIDGGYRVQYFVNGPLGKAEPKMGVQDRREVGPRQVL